MAWSSRGGPTDARGHSARRTKAPAVDEHGPRAPDASDPTMHPETKSDGSKLPSLRILPPWVVFHLPRAGCLLPADYLARQQFPGAELLELARKGADRLATELFVDPEGLSPNVRGELSRYVLDLDAPAAPNDLSPDLAKACLEAHQERLAAAVRKAVDLFGTCLLITATTFDSEDPARGDEAPEVCLGADPVHTAAETIEAFRASFTQAGFVVGTATPFRDAPVPPLAHGQEPALGAIRVAVRRREPCPPGAVPESIRKLGQRVREAILNALHKPGMERFRTPRQTTTRSTWSVNEAIDPFLVDLDTRSITAFVTHTLPSLPPALSLPRLLSLPTAVRTALGVAQASATDASHGGKGILRKTLDEANTEARLRGLRVRFLPGVRAESKAATDQPGASQEQATYLFNAAIRATAQVGRHQLWLRDFFALYGAESAVIVSLDGGSHQASKSALQRAIAELRLTFFAGRRQPSDAQRLPDPAYLVIGLGFEAAQGLCSRFPNTTLAWAGIDTLLRAIPLH